MSNQTPWGAVVVIVGLIAIVAVSITAMFHYKQANDVATATVGVSGVIAALVGAYFGIRGSSLAQANARER
jgi:membrane associated rhomboid family serine protease